MPTYEYRCNACKREFEAQQRMVDDDLVTCEVCGKDALERLISRTAFQFKGGGWYKDLYASTKPEPAGGEKAETAEKAATESTTTTPAAAAPAATPATPAAPAAPAPSGSGSSGGSSGSTGGSGSSSASIS